MLAKKVYTLYSLAVQQLSKQDHYDFGLRALVSVLRYAGRKKRANPTTPDEEVKIYILIERLQNIILFNMSTFFITSLRVPKKLNLEIILN